MNTVDLSGEVICRCGKSQGSMGVPGGAVGTSALTGRKLMKSGLNSEG